MLALLRSRLTYANVMATIAVFIALGGGAYAAIKLPANSVGTKQIKKKAVTPAKIAPSTVALFKGQKGAKGDTGIQGPPGAAGTPGTNGTNGTNGTAGAPAVKLFAYVHEDGSVVRGTPGTTAVLNGIAPNQYYIVSFPQSVANCVPVVSTGNTTSNGIPPGMPTARMVSDYGSTPNTDVEVDITDPANTANLKADAFNLIVVC